MRPQWLFAEQLRSIPAVDPIQGEFFATEALDGLSDALVREAIQNSLDAAQFGQKVKVRFFLSGSGAALHPCQAETYFQGLLPHLCCPGSGISDPPSTIDKPVPFLAIEDFRTRGLAGNPEQDRDIDGRANDFFYFWRNVGRSGKSDTDRGRWGLGKNVFPASSKINSFFGLTVRGERPSALLMGQSVLKVHQIGKEKFNPYGYWGLHASDGFALPVDAPSILQTFARDFRLKRESDSGLSVVIPFPTEDIKARSLSVAVVKQYFYAIASGALEVSIEESNSEFTIDDSTLGEVADQLDEETRRQLKPFLDLAQWAIEQDGEGNTVIAEDHGWAAPKWGDSALKEEQREHLRERLHAGECLGFDIGLDVRKKGAVTKKSSFRVYLERDQSGETHRPIFVREGIAITEAAKGKVSGIRALVIIDDKPLASLLGDAENPAHTEWYERSAHFQGKYEHGASCLRYVRNSVAVLAGMLAKPTEKADVSLLADVFWVPKSAKEESKENREKPAVKPGTLPPVPEVPEETKHRPFAISKIEQGFRVRGADNAESFPDSIKVTAAYAVRRGNPFAHYSPWDFRLDRVPLRVATAGATAEILNNEIVLSSLAPGFELTVHGFDPNRDIEVKAIALTAAEAAIEADN